MKRLALVCLASAFLLVGCAKEQPKPAPPGGVQINADGVKVNVTNKGVEVKTPGTGVKVNP